MKYKNYIKLAALLPLLALLGCEANETPGAESQETVPVTIRLGLEKDGLSTRATTANVITPDDAINKLDVYITGGGDDIHLTESDFNANKEATVTLTTGTKTIRAIANAGENPSSSIDALALISEENGIPMSTTQDTTWTIDANTTSRTVQLNRMVAKMNVSIVDDRNQNPTIESFSIASLLPSTTNLYRSKYGEVTFPSSEGQLSTWTWTNPNTITDGTTFYLHETRGTYNISLKLQGEEDTRSTSLNKEIPRNHYFPLIVHITDFTLDIQGTYEYAPIGVLPIKATITDNGREVNLPEGASNISISVTLKENGQVVTSGVTWDYPKEDESPFEYSVNENGTLTISAEAIPAVPTGTYTLTAKYEGREHKFDLTINIVGLEQATRSASQASQPIIIEL